MTCHETKSGLVTSVMVERVDHQASPVLILLTLEHLLAALFACVEFSLVRTVAGSLLELQSPLAHEVPPAHALLSRLHGHAARVQIVW